MLRFLLSLCLSVVVASVVEAGSGYRVTAQKDGKTVTYMVRFGGGRASKQHTAFDPVSKKFVYFNWKRTDKDPEPVSMIWDHQTGRMLKLYQFPGVKHPLPVIPSLDAMKVCPLTGDEDFESELVLAYD